jgi:hypothetical protein
MLIHMFFTSALVGMSGQLHALTALSSGSLGSLQNRSEQRGEIVPGLKLRFLGLLSVASRYTDCAVLAPHVYKTTWKVIVLYIFIL